MNLGLIFFAALCLCVGFAAVKWAVPFAQFAQREVSYMGPLRKFFVPFPFWENEYGYFLWTNRIVGGLFVAMGVFALLGSVLAPHASQK